MHIPALAKVAHHAFLAATIISESQISSIAPTSSSCDNAPAKGQCATAKVAAEHITTAFQTYKITEKGEQAAVIALMALETQDFKYNKPIDNTVPGKGTRNMQSPEYNKKYAQSIPSLSDKVTPVLNNPVDLLDVLRENADADFGSAAWFLTTQCTDTQRAALASGSEAGWEDYILHCVQAPEVTKKRTEYWTEAKKVLGVE